MTRCIYCRSELNRNHPPDDMTVSKEHVVPYALGGSDAFSTLDVSKKYNNQFGHDIDAKFINLLPLSIKRHILHIAGQSGKIPPITWRAQSLDNGARSTITIDADGRIDCSFDTMTERVETQKGEWLSVSGSPDKVTGILSGLLAKASKRGKEIYTTSGEKVRSTDDVFRQRDIEDSNHFRASIQAFDMDIWIRGIFKMVLGLGHILLGPEWTFSVDGGDRIRTVLVTERKEWPINCIRGFATGELPSEIGRVLGITAEVRKANRHTLAILPYEGSAVAIVSLFGGNDVPEALVSLGGNPGHLVVVNDTLKPDTRMGVQIDPTTRNTKWITMLDLLNAGP